VLCLQEKYTVEFHDLYVGVGGDTEGAQVVEVVTPRLGMMLLRVATERSWFPPQQGTLPRMFKAAPYILPACILQYRLIAEEGLQFV
jgi:hypothetical protein